MVFGTVHSDRTVVILLHKHFSSWLSTTAILLTLSGIIRMLIWESLTLQHLSTIPSPLSNLLITPNFSSIQNVLHQFFTWIALGDVDLCFSLLLVTKPMPLKGELYQTCDYITNVINPYTWLMAWQWSHFLLAPNTRQEWPQIVHAKLHSTENYCISSMPNHVKLKIIM